MLFEQKIEVVILDFDGVIIESNDIKDSVFDEIFKRFPEHYDNALQYHRTHISVSRFAKFDYLLEQLGKTGDAELKKELLENFSSVTLDKMKTVSFVKGAEDFLKAMQPHYPLYLASVTPIHDLEIILEHLQIRSYFKDVYGCPPWTKVDAVFDILSHENCSPQNAVLIGDSYGDQRTAKETGIHFIARQSGLSFEDPQPEISVNDLTGLATVIARNEVN
jgi:phosphoglycolate phosphatase-like HAD superfamily hydrolase